MGHKSRWEYSRATYGRYQKGDRKARQAILNEFCLNTGYHRKYAIRLLNGASPGPRASRTQVRRKRAQCYGPKTLVVLTAAWEAAGYPWSVWLKAMLPEWMPWIRRRFGIGRCGTRSCKRAGDFTDARSRACCSNTELRSRPTVETCARRGLQRSIWSRIRAIRERGSSGTR